MTLFFYVNSQLWFLWWIWLIALETSFCEFSLTIDCRRLRCIKIPLLEGLLYSLWMNKHKWWLKGGFRKQELLEILKQCIKHKRRNFLKWVHVLLSIPEFNLMVQAVFAAGSEYQMDETCYNTLEYWTHAIRVYMVKVNHILSGF